MSTLIGKTIHPGLELYYKGWFPELCTQEILRIWDEFLKRFSPDMTDEQQYKYGRGRRDTVAIFRNYLEHYKTQDLRTALHPLTGVPLVELEFEIPIYTPSGHPSRFFKLRGKIDRIIEDNGFWIQETKTRDQIEVDEDPTSATSSGSRLVLDQQSRTYSFAAQVYLGLPIQGVIYNLIKRKVPGRPRINKNDTVSLAMCDTTPEIFRKTLEKQHAAERGVCYVQCPGFHRGSQGSARSHQEASQGVPEGHAPGCEQGPGFREDRDLARGVWFRGGTRPSCPSDV